MSIVTASDITKDMAGEPLFRGVSFKLERRDRMTLSGRNGSGKTTLLRILSGQTGIDGGSLSIAKGAKVSLHDQQPPRERNITLRDYVLSGAKEVVAVEEQLQRLEQAMAEGAHDEATLSKYARAQAEFERHGGYHWRDRALATARGLGFTDADLDRKLATFSGGELTRGSLARALTGDPDLILLDEPTNHLDIASLEWLETHLQTLDAAIVLVAHDRWFLEAVGTSVLEIEAGRARFFKGPWHAWRKEQAAREIAAGRAIERQQAEIARLERFVERFRAKASKAKQAQSRVKRLDKMERLEADPRDSASLEFSFDAGERTGRVIFEMEKGLIEVPGRVLLENAEIWLERGEHVALVGGNGTGKTTLISTLVGERELPAGKLRKGHNVQLGYLSQHADDLSGDGTVLDALQRATKLTPGKARALLGRFLFSGDDALKPLRGLSGGERQRLSLAILVHSGSNVLILDEPTNHLDLDSREALEDALRGFGGSLLLVSHDRALLDAVGSRTVSIEDGELRNHEGGWADFVRERDERRAAESAAVAAGKRADVGTKPKKGKPAKSSNGGPSKNAKRAQRELERELEVAEKELRELEEELADPAAWEGEQRAAESGRKHEAAKQRVEELYKRWSQGVS